MNKTFCLKTKNLSLEIKYPVVFLALLLIATALFMYAKLSKNPVRSAYALFVDVLLIVGYLWFVLYGAECRLVPNDEDVPQSEPSTAKATTVPKADGGKKLDARKAAQKRSALRESNAPMKKVPIPTSSKTAQMEMKPQHSQLTEQMLGEDVDVKAKKEKADAILEEQWSSLLDEVE